MLGKLVQLLRYIHIRPAYVAVPVVLALFSALFEGVGMGLLIPILNGFFQKSFAFAKDVPLLGDVLSRLPASYLENDRMLFGVILGGFIGVYVMKNVVRYLSVLSIQYFAERTLHHLRKLLFARYLSFGKLFFDTTNVGHHTVVIQEFARLALYPVLTADRLINAVFSLTAYLTVMVFISWKLTLIGLPLFALLHFAIRFMVVRIRGVSNAIADRGSDLGKTSVEILSTMALVKAHRTEKREQDHFTSISDQKAKLDFRVHVLQELIMPMQEIISLLAASAIFVGALVFLGRDQLASAPAILVFFYMVMNASQKFGAISGFSGTLAAASGSINAVLELFDDKGKFFVKGGSKECGQLKTGIDCRNLTFSYASDRKILQDISCTFACGKMTAIVGPTGAGKSTLINLLMRFYDCPSGSVFFDGTDIREFSLDSYMRHIALVSQETLLMHDTLRNNIAYGLDRIDEQALLAAVERARLSQFISKLPQGLDTLIGDRGVKLSGGEKQRVSIARALLKGAEILILDEATSSLDTQTEKLIQEAIDEAVQGRTAIVIAHRLSTIKHADRIVVLQDGTVAEQGSLQELLDRKGVFHGLWEGQKF